MIIPTRLPSGYREVEYIESSGTQAINTGVDIWSVCDKLKCELDMQILNTGQAEYGYQGVGNWGGYYGYYLKIPGSIHASTLVFSSGQYASSNTEYPNDHQRHLYSFDCVSETLYVDGVFADDFEKENCPGDMGNIFLFCGAKSNAIMVGVKERMYSCKLYFDGELIRNFVPCYRVSDSEIGLYDLVNGVFYTNVGTGTFTKGADIVLSKINLNPRIPTQYQELDFIQSTGSEYIDTGVCIYDYYDKIKMEVDMQLTPGASQNEYCYQGAGMAGSSGYYFSVPGFWTGSNNIDVSIGNGNTANCVHTFTNARDTYRHKIYVDAYNGECGFDDDTYTGLEYSSISSGLGTGNINLFAIRSYSESARNYIKMCLYGCTITDMSTNIKLRDFVPCYRVSDGVVGLYDLVTETFFTNQGNGAFVKGGEKSVFQIKDANGNVIWKNNEEIEFVYDNESSSHFTDQGGDCLVDGDPNTKWCANYVNGMWVAFHTNRPIAPMSYSLMTGSDTASYPGRNPISWKLYGKARMEDNWVLIDSHTNDSTMGATNNQWYDFQISNPNNNLYKYFYIEVDAISSGSILQIAELKIHETRVTDRYQEVAWIGSDGNPYIDVGVQFNYKSRVETEFATLTSGDSGYAFVVGVTPRNLYGRWSMGTWNSKFWTTYGQRGEQYSYLQPETTYDTDFHKWIYDYSDRKFSMPELELEVSFDGVAMEYSSGTLKFFYGMNQGTAGKIKSFKQWHDEYPYSDIMHDFVPCYRKSDGVIGMYDLVTGTFYTNAGSGTFTKGNDV